MGKRSRNNEEGETEETDLESGYSEERPVTDEAPDEAAGVGHEDDGDGRRARVMRFAKRLMDRRELSNDTREILGTVIATSDKAKTEAVKLVAREVRSYLDALELKDDLKELITSYSLEISLSLKPLEHTMAAAGPAVEPEPEPELEEEDETGLDEYHAGD